MAQGNGAFRWRQVAWGEVLVCEPLFGLAPHVFTTRHVSVARDATDDTGREGAVAAFLGVDRRLLLRCRQVHGTAVYIASSHVDARAPVPDADILVTALPHLAVSVRVADCVPILLADRRIGAVGAVHAGWRGTCAGAVGVAVDTLQRQFGSRPSDLVAAVGPAIGPCCYQVGSDVFEAFARAEGDRSTSWFRPDGDRWTLDLWAATRDQLLRAGLGVDAVHVAGECTASGIDRYFSYRREGARAGRLVAAIRPGTRRG